MKLVLADPTPFKDSIVVISELVNEARFKVTRDGMQLVAMDPANVAMVVFKLLSSCFTEYELAEDTDMSLNLANLKQVLKRTKPSDVVTLEMPEENMLQITLTGKTKRTFKIPLIEIDDEEQKPPSLNFPIKIETGSSNLHSAIEDAGIVAESVSFSADPEKFMIEGAGDLSRAHIEMKADAEETKITSETTASVKSKYSIEYLKKMMSGAKLADRVEICFSQDYPLRLNYNVIDKLQLSFILAPRVENN
jgi:proliferating cell nuclear antigen